MSKHLKLHAYIPLLFVIFLLLAACASKQAAAPNQSNAPAIAASSASSVPTATPSPSPASKVLTIGTTGELFPYVYKNTKDNKLEGYEVDVWNAISQKLGYKIEWQVAEFAGLFGLMDTGKIDTITNSISVTDARKEKYYFTTPYIYSGPQLVVKKGNDAIQTLEDLKGKKIAIVSGSAYVNYVKEADKDNKIQIVNYESGDATLNDVALGRVDATFATRASGLAQIKKTGLPLQLAGKQLSVAPAAGPFVKNEKTKTFVEQINKALQELQNDGTLTKLSVQWYTEDLSKPAP